MSNQFGRSGICWPPDCAIDSERGAVDTEKRLWGTLPGGFRMTREGVENISIEDVDGEGRSRACGQTQRAEVPPTIGKSFLYLVREVSYV
jgi:hypothetical protein